METGIIVQLVLKDKVIEVNKKVMDYLVSEERKLSKSLVPIIHGKI